MCYSRSRASPFSDDEFSRSAQRGSTQGEQPIGVESFTGNFPAHYRTGSGTYRHHQDPAQWIPIGTVGLGVFLALVAWAHLRMKNKTV